MTSPRADNQTQQPLLAIAQIAPQNTQMLINLTASGNPLTVLTNSHAVVIQGKQPLPAMLIESGTEHNHRMGWSVWGGLGIVELSLIDAWSQNREYEIDAIWNKLDQDARRVKANLLDHPTLPYNGQPTVRRLQDVELIDYGKRRDTHEGRNVVRRLLIITYKILPFSSAA